MGTHSPAKGVPMDIGRVLVIIVIVLLIVWLAGKV